MSFEQSFAFLLKWEGGFGNDPRDPGGATNLGVIQTEYDTYRRNAGKLPQSVAHITRAEAEDIYRAKYWDLVHCDEMNPGTANAVFDASVNSGPARGVRWLQQAINQVAGKQMVDVDESIGPKTLTAAALCAPDKLIDAMLSLRLAFMHVARHPGTGALLWPTFGRGWQDRINGVRIQSHNLAGLPTPAKPIGGSSMKANIPVASPINGNAVVKAAVTAATTPVKSIISSITGMFGSAIFTGIGGALSMVAPNLTVEILGAVGIAAGLVSLAAHAYALVTGLSATNNATIALAENLLNTIETSFGGKPLVFDNAPLSVSSATA